jgi:hypothetical protein
VLGGAEREREMNRKQRIKRSSRTLLVLLTVVALGLAASPAALAAKRGGPGQPGVQPTYVSVPIPLKILSLQFVSWSD